MARLVIKDSITSGGALVSGQTLRLGGCTMSAYSAFRPKATPQVAENPLSISPEYSDKMDPTNLSSLNKLLDHIATLGVSTDYDRIGLKPDRREIKSQPVTHQVAVVEEQRSDSSSILRTNYVQIPELSEPDTRLREDMAQALNLESDSGPNLLGNIPVPELLRSETPAPLGLRSGRVRT